MASSSSSAAVQAQRPPAFSVSLPADLSRAVRDREEGSPPVSASTIRLSTFTHQLDPRDFRGRLDYVDGFRRLQSTTFLLMGALSGIMGFAFAGFLGIYKYKNDAILAGTNFRGDLFESGRHFHPATVSEMVRDYHSPEGKIFYAFGILASVCILVSAYPWCLRNVFIGHDHSRLIRPLCGSAGERPIWVNLISLRQFLPPVGLMMVVCITVTTGPRTFCEAVAAGLHTVGAVLMFVAYIAFEFHALWWSPVLYVRGLERWFRKWLAILALICSVGFQLCGLCSTILQKSCVGGLCSCKSSAPFTELCVDKWQVPTLDDIAYSRNMSYYGAWVREATALEDKEELLLNTASGWYLVLKMATYWLEVCAGLFLLTSHLVIWYFCPERNVELGCELPDIQNQYRNMDTEQARLQGESRPSLPPADDGGGQQAGQSQ